MNTQQITKELHDTGRTHKPIVRMLMTYKHDGKNHAHILNLYHGASREMLVRTVSWAASHGVEITLRPV